jgi:uncharacterized membrane protein (UPF0127 family)|tara:strand:- start:3716 stop:5980 length:2265 start_codon:yes stop_codon:yes gene_type:complete
MIKKSWPFTGDTRLQMGNEEHGDWRDIPKDTQRVPEGLIPENYRDVLEDEEIMDAHPYYSSTYSEGVVSPVEEQDELDVEDLISAFSNFVSESESTLCLGIDNIEGAKSIPSNLVSISNNTSIFDSIYKVSADIRYYNFGIKFDSFFLNNPIGSTDIYLENVYSQTRPMSRGIVISRDPEFASTSKRIGFSCNKIYNNAFFLTKDELSKKAVVSIFSKGRRSNAPTVIFSCDIAKTFNEKSSGLQVYPDLSKESGLLFDYDKPTDVIYHMGSVRYPIDIVFISESNHIKKICKSIRPGSTSTFGCSGVKRVLEICGGLSSKIGLSEGDIVTSKSAKAEVSEDFEKLTRFCNQIGINNIFLKRTNHLSTSAYSYHDINIFNINKKSQDSISKIASKNIKPKRYSEKSIVIFDMDEEVFSKNSKIRLFASKSLSEEEDDISIDIYNNPYSPIRDSEGKRSWYDVPADKFLSKGFNESFPADYSLRNGSGGSLHNFASEYAGGRCFDMIDSLHKSGSNSDIVFITRSDCDRTLLKECLYLKIIDYLGIDKLGMNIDITRVDKDLYGSSVVKQMSDKYQTESVKLASVMVKSAGMPVADNVKNRAKSAESFFDRSDKLCEKIFNNIRQNIDEYEKIKENADSVSKTKGQYNESVKRNGRLVKRLLVNIRDGIKIMNEVKDISTTSEIIDALALSAKETSSMIKDIFNLAEKIESPDFYALLLQKTDELENLIGDLRSTLSRMRQYINSNIIGVVILSE